MGFWSRSPPAITHEYQESVAHRVRDILNGSDHSSHKYSDKAAIKALQRPEALAGVIEILKTMPEPCHREDGWEIDEGIDLDSDDDSDDNELAANGLVLGGAKPMKPSPTVVVAGATIAAAAATSAAAAALAVTIRDKKRLAKDEIVEAEDNITVGPNGTITRTTTTKTIIKFRPSKTSVSSCAYWWGYEIFIPQDALSRIASAQDVSSAFLGFLGSVGLVVPAIVPFLGYIAAYVGLEFAVIKAQNEGRGVILASTWLVPVALVPRAWDLPDEDSAE
ncbi:hypothetical protein BGZ76_002335 [Entomortierella beljakovae]|nr:hypothetical protein BGZ76_002335 [Entomortierella beljakovae]